MNKTEWKSVIVDASYVESYSPKCNRIDISSGSSMNLRIWLYIPAKLCRYNGCGQCKISYLPHFDYAEKLEAFVAERAEAKYEIEIGKKLSAAIWAVFEKFGIDCESDTFEQHDTVMDEWKNKREEAAHKARCEAVDADKTDAEIEAAERAAARKVDEAYLAEYGATAVTEPRSKCAWRPAVDPNKEEIIKHVPAPLTPVEIEADPELVR